jgi:hypothetical protein
MRNPFRRLFHREADPGSADVHDEVEAELGHEDESRRLEEHREHQAEFELGHGPHTFEDETR